ncbi:DUF305 domain-containing protein [Agrobacterium pusense]|uniref:DUF305 domain-containing protein n=1 Tax=Agrobacterium pusense TaxID=648995 RepID=A0A6H0ZW00_9HYPH|nr:DUF305 domain-containing protein [Agrobacterium pusense]PZP59505.1 MAG: DUF305 domain-containing protein [Delftia acidovorans]QIX24021.1 DUF305 domain-containing protein [Agrobacterium pusense]
MEINLRAPWAALLLAMTVVASPALAQMEYPEKCKSNLAPSGGMAMGDHGISMPETTEYQNESMKGMKSMSMNMMQGMMKKDPDVSFVCGMIAHHMGAISMAQVELKYGDNVEAKADAQRIIDAQTKEIEKMTAWVEKEVK